MLLAGCSVVGIRSGTEEPAFTVIGQTGDAQIRQYAPRLAASVTVQGNEVGARSAGFTHLARFIFGANTAQKNISMTAPVAQSSATITMTAPVAQNQDVAGTWTISFFMPAAYSLVSLPKPNDPGIHIAKVPAQIFAVYRYSGIPGPAATARAHAKLLAALAASAWQPTAQMVDWFYDPPWTIPWARRNEAAIAVSPRT